MPMTSLSDLLDSAAGRGRGVGAFNVITLEYAEALVTGAEKARAGVVLQISQNCVRYHGSLAPIALATMAVARAAAVPVAVHLDHADDAGLVHEAVELGIGSVMFDASALAYEANVVATVEIVRHCHAHGVVVEAELGEIGGKDGVHAPDARTDPDEAAAFVAATGVDALAVAVGTSHAMRTRDACVDHDLIRRLRSAVPVPLVLHGSSGVSDADVGRAIDAGMTKINVSTHLNIAFTATLRRTLASDPDLVDPRLYMAGARTAITDETARLLGVFTSPHRASHVGGVPPDRSIRPQM